MWEPRCAQHRFLRAGRGCGCASALLRHKDCHTEDDPSPSKQRLVPSSLNPFQSLSQLSTRVQNGNISPQALFIPSSRAAVLTSHLQSLQLLFPDLPLRPELPNPLSTSPSSHSSPAHTPQPSFWALPAITAQHCLHAPSHCFTIFRKSSLPCPLQSIHPILPPRLLHTHLHRHPMPEAPYRASLMWEPGEQLAAG